MYYLDPVSVLQISLGNTEQNSDVFYQVAEYLKCHRLINEWIQVMYEEELC